MKIHHTHFFVNCHSLPQPTINLLLITMDLSILDFSYKWNHVICDLLSLAPLTQHVLKFIHIEYFSVLHSFLWLDNINYYLDHMLRSHLLFIHYLVDGHLICFKALAIMINVALYNDVHAFVWTYVFISLM